MENKMNWQRKKPMDYSWPFQIDKIETYAFYKNAFSSNEIKDIVEHCKSFRLYDGVIGSENTEKVVKNVRDSKIAFIPPDGIEWVYERLTGIIENLNKQFFNFELHGFTNGLQFTEYKAPQQHYSWHRDRALGHRVRKLSIVLQLSDENSYDGGDLEILTSPDKDPMKTPREKGTLIAFPSYEVHRVSPVTKGTRNSLVGWVTGYPFK